MRDCNILRRSQDDPRLIGPCPVVSARPCHNTTVLSTSLALTTAPDPQTNQQRPPFPRKRGACFSFWLHGRLRGRGRIWGKGSSSCRAVLIGPRGKCVPIGTSRMVMPRARGGQNQVLSPLPCKLTRVWLVSCGSPGILHCCCPYVEHLSPCPACLVSKPYIRFRSQFPPLLLTPRRREACSHPSLDPLPGLACSRRSVERSWLVSQGGRNAAGRVGRERREM